jgi:nucleosome binding factor SPN SPT16 subunit
MITNAVEFEAKIDDDWKISIPIEYRGYLSSLSRVILLNANVSVAAKKEDKFDIQKRISAFNRLDGMLENCDVDFDKLCEERKGT